MAERELTPEGQKLYDQLMSMTGDEEIVIEKTIKKVKRIKALKDWNPYELELRFIKLEILKMIRNSELVIEDCREIIRKFTSAEEYMLNDTKVAMNLHENLIKRLQRMFQGLPAFENEEHLGKVELNDDPTELHAPEPWYNRGEKELASVTTS